jgi:hypothetical protein
VVVDGGDHVQVLVDVAQVEPLPGELRALTSPPIMRASLRLIVSPRPVPPNLRVVDPSACWNGSKICAS